MGFVPPPLELTSEEFNKRWAAGARTFEELDPAFCEWNRRGERMLKFQIATIIVAVIGMAIVAF